VPLAAALALVCVACQPKIGREWRHYPEPMLLKALELLPKSRVVEVNERVIDGAKTYEVGVESPTASMMVLFDEEARVLGIERRLEVYELPPEVFEALDRLYPEGFIVEVDALERGEERWHAIELQVEETGRIEVTLDADAGFRSVTEPVEWSRVPKAALAAAREAAGEGPKLGEVMRVKTPEGVSYEVDMVDADNGTILNVLVSDEGEVRRRAQEPLDEGYKMPE